MHGHCNWNGREFEGLSSSFLGAQPWDGFNPLWKHVEMKILSVVLREKPECSWFGEPTSLQKVNGGIIIITVVNSQLRIMHFAYSDWFAQSWLSAHIP